MLRQSGKGDLWWGPGHLATGENPANTGLWMYYASGYLFAGVELAKRIEQIVSVFAVETAGLR